MKLKNILLVLVGGMLAACSSSDDSTGGGIGGNDGNIAAQLKGLPETEVYAGVSNAGELQQINASTRAAGTLLPAAATTKAYFFVRVDSHLGLKDSKGNNTNFNTYYPLPNGGNAAMVAANTGAIYTNYPYKVNKEKYMEHYVFSTDGSATANAIESAPSMESVLTAVADNSKSYVVLDKNNLPADVNPDKLHVIWYVVKKEMRGDRQWHVDGVLTDQDDINAVKALNPGMTFNEQDNLELEDEKFDPNAPVVLPFDKEVIVDIHQQEHKDWGEIKTSVHIKAPEDVTIFLPIVDTLLVQNPDIMNEIRIRDFEAQIDAATLNATYFSKLKVNVERANNGIYIKVTGLTPVLLKAIEDRYADGLTVEVHTFTTYNEKDIKTVWNMIRKSSVTTNAKVSGRITSAYNKIATDNKIFNEQGEAIYDDGEELTPAE